MVGSGSLRIVASIVLVGALTSCFFYTARVHVMTSSGFSSDELRKATRVVGETVAQFGLVTDPYQEADKRISREPKDKQLVVAVYSAGTNAETWHRVAVYVEVNKGTGEFSVLMRDLDSVRGTQLTDSLERAVARSLREAFPAHEIEVRRDTVGPAFGP